MAFRGWPAEALDFYEGLEADNSKTYWVANKAIYDDKVHGPMTELLAELEPEFGAAKIFRPYRDVRFSADKSPYKTAIAASFEHGGYVHLSAKGLAAGSGRYMLSPAQLDRYRRAVADDAAGGHLLRIIAEATAKHIDITGHDSLKTVPRGYPRDHPRAGLLRNKGLVAWKEWPAASWLGRPIAKTKVVELLRDAEPLNAWIAAHIGDDD
jgi:uncharacterized protein (TIGR02453 family)